ncbi:phosphotransferase [Pengzhenrongella frigida]|uniref:Aminoglycoside phosphotransferase family protein n=1 Tax=Pengzhenrongella frigida TaxID=1259133 RepID=A0A4Q5MZM7_9MICO|nr:phosphotransferase [Cellulomonas sp. HLT2-17]RYV51195.1 aminoglycoside phosphotransferase family protein [Cellulomonas sp. HLT2-17]
MTASHSRRHVQPAAPAAAEGLWSDDEVEVPLPGGDVTDGVVRVGDTVRRPIGPHSRLVHDVLTHLDQVGFAGSPRFLGLDAKGREVLTFVAGEVAGRPWPAWVADERRIVSVARLVRSYDDAVVTLPIPESGADPQFAAPAGTPPSVAGRAELLGHMDVTPENVVFRDAEAVALIDFDLVRPATRAEEVGNVLQWWAPLMPIEDREPVLRDVDPIARAMVIVDAYGLSDADRDLLVPVMRNAADRTWYLMKQRAEDLGGG